MSPSRSEPLVSVIIPTYNRGHYLVTALESALAQHEVSTEIIVVDDGSTDDTPERLVPYRDRVRYIRQTNAGAGAARNRGMQAASGEYLAFLDSDDIWEPSKLALQLAYMQQHPEVDLVCTDFSGFNDDGLLATSYITTYCSVIARRERRFDKIFEKQEPFYFIGRIIPSYRGNVRDTILDGYFTLTTTVMMRRRCIECCGYQDETLPTSEDYEYYLRLTRHHLFAYLDVPTARYRHGHADQLSGRHREIETFRVWEKMAMGIRSDPTYYPTHRRHVEHIIRRWRHCLGKTLYREGDYAGAAAAFMRSVKDYPFQYRDYINLVRCIVPLLRDASARQRRRLVALSRR